MLARTKVIGAVKNYHNTPKKTGKTIVGGVESLLTGGMYCLYGAALSLVFPLPLSYPQLFSLGTGSGAVRLAWKEEDNRAAKNRLEKKLEPVIKGFNQGKRERLIAGMIYRWFGHLSEQ
ncbi:hypothetical protein HYX12_02815 [Candidatus Woesearchaeota archaeon]|nr:hypothetical protein [Candidatus Woesearchaeota archaeon]